MANTAVTVLRVVGFLEGLSWIALMVAMVVKRVYHHPEAIRVPGMIHGLLFLLFCSILVLVMYRRRWSFGRGAAVFVSSLFPFGTFIMDSRLKRWAQE